MKEIPLHKKKERSSIYNRTSDFIRCQISFWKNYNSFKALRRKKEGYGLQGFDELQCIYVHIPKVAGVSINKSLFGNLGGGHRTVRSYKRIFGPITYRRYFKFTFVRNPYSRIFSAYHFLKHGGFNEKDRLWANANLQHIESFEQFVNEWLNEKSKWTYIHFYPQAFFVCDNYLEPEVNFIGKFERLEKDFTAICKKLKTDKKLKIHNKGTESAINWKDVYTLEMKQIIYKLYREDFELFGYSSHISEHTY